MLVRPTDRGTWYYRVDVDVVDVFVSNAELQNRLRYLSARSLFSKYFSGFQHPHAARHLVLTWCYMYLLTQMATGNTDALRSVAMKKVAVLVWIESRADTIKVRTCTDTQYSQRSRNSAAIDGQWWLIL